MMREVEEEVHGFLVCGSLYFSMFEGDLQV